jgi:preprotein translocase SecE subunit
VARDRQRAKQRKARRGQNPGPARSQPRRTDVPGELEHASGEVDEFEAALVQGADGQPADSPDAAEAAEAFGEEEDREAGRRAFGDEDDDLDVDDAILDEEAAAAAPRREAATPGASTRKGPGRFIGFLLASWAELQRVQWPDRHQVAQATGVVIGFVIIAGLYLGVADWVAKQVVNAII